MFNISTPEHATFSWDSTPELPGLTTKEIFPTKSRVDVVVGPVGPVADNNTIPKTTEITRPEYNPLA
jgi:hypothetical protein